MTSPQAMTPRQAWMLILAASAILMITMGACLASSLFLFAGALGFAWLGAALIKLPVRAQPLVRPAALSAAKG